MSYELLATATTVVSFLTFIAILGWALSRRRRAAFATAAQLPFALDDEFDADAQRKTE
jgi:cbb3-type cytochrome oxidase subunit 3